MYSKFIHALSSLTKSSLVLVLIRFEPGWHLVLGLFTVSFSSITSLRAGPGTRSSSTPLSYFVVDFTFQLKINGPQKIDFKSFGGDVTIEALKAVQLKAKGQGGTVALTFVPIVYFSVVRSHLMKH